MTKSSGCDVQADIYDHAGGSCLMSQVEQSLGYVLIEVRLSPCIANLRRNILHDEGRSFEGNGLVRSALQ
jgi:hypothetical protein